MAFIVPLLQRLRYIGMEGAIAWSAGRARPAGAIFARYCTGCILQLEVFHVKDLAMSRVL